MDKNPKGTVQETMGNTNVKFFIILRKREVILFLEVREYVDACYQLWAGLLFFSLNYDGFLQPGCIGRMSLIA